MSDAEIAAAELLGRLGARLDRVSMDIADVRPVVERPSHEIVALEVVTLSGHRLRLEVRAWD